MAVKETGAEISVEEGHVRDEIDGTTKLVGRENCAGKAVRDLMDGK